MDKIIVCNYCEINNLNLSIFDSIIALQIKNYFSKEECYNFVKKIYDNKQFWNSDYGGEQYSVGQNFYAMCNANKEAEYFENSKQVSNHLNKEYRDLMNKVTDVFSHFSVSEPFTIKPDWCNPGVVVFPKNEYVALNSGPIHIDAEGLRNGELLDFNSKTLSFIGMLQKPEKNGNLRIWDIKFTPDSNEDDLIQIAKDNYYNSFEIVYEEGDLVIINSLNLHQILSFEGSKDRITTLFFSSFLNGKWNIWF